MASTTRPSSPVHPLDQSRQTTLLALSKIDDTTLLQLTKLTLPEIRAIQQDVAQVFPAGNLPAFVLSGLLTLKGRLINPDQVSHDLTTLLRGLSLIPQGLYGVLIAGPAAVLYAYQQLLRLAGQDLGSAFPQGTWQFYLQFGLREDTARHTNETIGFHQAFPQADSATTTVDATAAAAWACAAIELLYDYDNLLAADWSERVMLRIVIEEAAQAGLADRHPFASLVSDWNKARPYHRPPDGVAYVPFREAAFQRFVQERVSALPPDAKRRSYRRYMDRLAEELAAYQEQMTILAALEPDRYQEYKRPVPLWQTVFAFIWQGCTYLLPACRWDEQGHPLCFPSQDSDVQPIPLHTLLGETLCDAQQRPLTVDRSGRVSYQDTGRLLGRLRPPNPETILGWVAAILSTPASGAPSDLDLLLAASPRAAQQQLRQDLSEATRLELAALGRAPIILNWDAVSHALSLADIRQGRRGVGDHALTIFRTDRSMVFDQSHIFFDGMWGLAVAEILSDSAVYWRRRLEGQRFSRQPTPVPLRLNCPAEVEASARAQLQPGEASAESKGVNVQRLHRACQWLRQRGARLTVNDLLLLYRCFHAARYQPSPAVQRGIEDLRRSNLPEARAAVKSIETTLARFRETNPAILIPMDASNVSPKERIFPTTFRNPLADLLDQFAAAQKCYMDYRARPDAKHWPAFDQARRELLAYLKAFGELLDTLKAVTMRGESFNTATIRLLGHLPASMQYVLDQIPQRIGFLNEVIKGNEVFSNVGRVAPGVSLTRFTSAKDDGQTKELVWGVLTDDQDQMVISLRDFRPFVPLLLASGESALANRLAQDYLDRYVEGFNRFLVELGDIIAQKEPL